ncbi:MAG: phosphatase PAP2 family protein [Chitinophagaceae bacterium]|nr:MAG: phosphatase PAP2 family protein [Chitinophagaceae bacterium]
MKIAGIFVLFFLLGSKNIVLGQNTDTLVRKLDSLSNQMDSAGGQINNTAPPAYNEATAITPKTYFILLWSDIKQAYTKPFHMTGRDWRVTGEFALVAGGVALLDEPIQRQALEWRNSSAGLRKTSNYITNFGGTYEVYVLGGLGLAGYVFKNKKMQTTTLLASQSYITGALLETTLKFVTGRDRPYIVDPNTLEAEPRFHGPFYKTPKNLNGGTTNSAFPSGHTTVAFAAATVYALEYKDRIWVPILAYSAAGLIGLSRIIENKHWATDVLCGAALGYLSGRLTVNNYHRYAQIKTPGTRKATVAFNLQYRFGQIAPGFVYTFR